MADQEKLTDVLENQLPDDYKRSFVSVKSNGDVDLYLLHEEFDRSDRTQITRSFLRDTGYEIQSVGVTSMSTMFVFSPD